MLLAVLLLLLLLAAGRPAPMAEAAANARSVPATPPPPSAARLQRLAELLVRPFAPVAPEAVSAPCRQHSRMYLESLAQLAPWAMHMYDSSTKLPASLLAGNTLQLGDFDQCVSVRVADGNTGTDVFRGRHCTASVAFRAPSDAAWEGSALSELLQAAANTSGQPHGARPGGMGAPYYWSFCVPSSCSPTDVELALRARLVQGLGFAALAGRPLAAVSVSEKRCLTADGGRQGQPLQRRDVAFICLLLVTLYIVAASTAYDILCVGKGPPSTRAQELLVAFSACRNGAALLSAAQSGDTMGCLHGLRVLSMAWVVLFHTFYSDIVSPHTNSSVIAKLGDAWSNMPLLNATLATDTFLLLSGALLAVSFLRSDDRQPFAWSSLPAFYWHRYARLTPVYAVCVWFYASLLPRVGSGPLWERTVAAESDHCVSNWWTNLAYVNNLFGLDAPCISQTWYLATDMQLFVLSPLVLVPVVRWPRLRDALLLILVILSMLVPFTITATERLAGAMLYTLDQSMVGRVFVAVYLRVYNRAGPYLVGIYLGRQLSAVRRQPPRLSAAVVTLSWAAASAACLSAVFGVFGFYQRDHLYSAFEAGLYAGTHRTVWAMGVAWVVYACVSGYGGPVNALLSWRPFAPLARLTYCAYLSHFVVIMAVYYTRRTPGHFSCFHMVNNALGILVITFAVSAVLSLAYEMPFLTLDRVLLPRAGTKSRSPLAALAGPRAAPHGAYGATWRDRPALNPAPCPGPAAKKARSVDGTAAPSITTVEEHLGGNLAAYDNATFEKEAER